MSPIQQELLTIDQLIAELRTLVETGDQALIDVCIAKGEWTPAEVLDHLVQIHRTVVHQAKEKKPLPKRPFYLRIRRKVVNTLLSKAIRVPSKGANPTGQVTDAKDAVTQLERQHQKLSNVLSAEPNPAVIVMQHPIAGPLTDLETLRFLAAHTTYHVKVLKKLSQHNP